MSVHDENQSETSMHHYDKNYHKATINSVGFADQSHPLLYFGNHYIGHKFNIDDIESTINSYHSQYKRMTSDEKEAGYMNVEYDGRIIDW